MAEIVNTLFGVTPESYRQAQQQQADTQALQYAKLDPFQQANYSIGRGANMLGGAIGGALGGQDPELQRITRAQQIAGQIDYNDDDSMKQGIVALNNAGDPRSAMQLQQILIGQQAKRASIGKDEAAARASDAAATRDRTKAPPEKVQLARQVALLTGFDEGTPEYNTAFATSLKEQIDGKPAAANIKEVGLAANTNQKGKNVYLDINNDVQFTYGTDAAGKQIRVPFNGLLVQKTSGEGGGAGGAAGTGTVEVVDPQNPTKTIIVTKAEAVQNRLTPAKAIEGLTPKMRQQLEADYPKATTSLKGHQSKSALFIKDLEALRDSPGLESITGFAAGRAPGFTDAGRKAVALYDKVVAKGGFQTLQDMRDMSKTGGALGNTSNRDISLLIAAFAAIDRKQSAKDVQDAIDNLIAELKGGLERLQNAYDLTYEYRKANTAPAATNIESLLNKYK